MVTLVPSDAFWGLTDTVPFPLPAPTETVYLLELEELAQEPLHHRALAKLLRLMAPLM